MMVSGFFRKLCRGCSTPSTPPKGPAVEPVSGSASACPLCASTVAPPVLPVSTDGVQPASQIFTGRAVLVLDDEESIRMLLGEGLSAHGLHVDTAQSPNEALQLIKSRPYDVLLCDLNLSPAGFATSGQEVALEMLAAAGPDKPEVVFMTGDLPESESMPGEPRRLQKPFRVSDVLNVLREVLAATPAGKLRS